MNATISMLLVSTVVTAFAPLSAAQETNQPKVSSRRLVDVSVEGLGEAARWAPGDTTRGGSLGLSARRPTESTLPLDCVARITDQATGGCVTASSTATFGLLYPYPGINNMIVPQAFVGGGVNNQATALRSTVGGGSGNIASGYYNSLVYGHATVGGGETNTASGAHSTVGGGRDNRATERWSTVAGGMSNRAFADGATVGGGSSNSAGPLPFFPGSGVGATVAGGTSNTASGGYSTVGGGIFNSALGDFSMVGGGFLNGASGSIATVPGGRSNAASGAYSFAAGLRAKANHDGAFVWGDGQNVDKPSSVADEFNVYASGGVRMFTNSAATTGVLLAPGGSTWTMVSDRDTKENVEPVDARSILDKVAQLPLATWNYKAQDDSIRHMGPMAQDFYAAFGLGLGDKTIDTIDPNGVALAAIQGLNAELEERLAEKDEEIEDLRAANEALLARVERLEARVQPAMAR